MRKHDSGRRWRWPRASRSTAVAAAVVVGVFALGAGAWTIGGRPAGAGGKSGHAQVTAVANSSEPVAVSFVCGVPVLGNETFSGTVSGTAPATVDPGSPVTVSDYQTTVSLSGSLTSDLAAVGIPSPLTGNVTEEDVTATNATPGTVNAAATPLPVTIPFTAGQPATVTSPPAPAGPFTAGSSGTIDLAPGAGPGAFTFEALFGSLGNQTVTCAPQLPVPNVASTTITTGGGPLTVTTNALLTATAGLTYSDSLSASGGTPPYTWSLASGPLPPGLTLDPTSGAISGIPTTAGTFRVSVEVTDSSTPALTATSATLPLEVGPAVVVPDVYTWGSNGFPGNVGALQYDVPTPLPMPGGTRFTQLASGTEFSVGLTSAGTVYAWGANEDGQLGDGTSTTGSPTTESGPVAVHLPAGVLATAVAAGGYHALALTSTGAVYAWGFNGEGQLGNGSTNGSNVPVPVSLPPGAAATAVAAGGDFSLALSTSGSVLAWGDDGNGQLGNGSKSGSSVPVTAGLPAGITGTQIAAGADSAMALGSDGTLYAWGDNDYGQLGDGTTTERTQPVAVRLPAGTALTAIAAGATDGLALGNGGSTLYAWGYNRFGQLGDSTTTQRTQPVAVRLPAGTALTAIAAGQRSALALTSTGRVLAWGDNDSGQLGLAGGRAKSLVPRNSRIPRNMKTIGVGSGPLSNASLALVELSVHRANATTTSVAGSQAPG